MKVQLDAKQKARLGNLFSAVDTLVTIAKDVSTKAESGELTTEDMHKVSASISACQDVHGLGVGDTAIIAPLLSELKSSIHNA